MASMPSSQRLGRKETSPTYVIVGGTTGATSMKTREFLPISKGDSRS